MSCTSVAVVPGSICRKPDVSIAFDVQKKKQKIRFENLIQPSLNLANVLDGFDRQTWSRIIRTTPTSSASTLDPAPSRGWCPIAKASPL